MLDITVSAECLMFSLYMFQLLKKKWSYIAEKSFCCVVSYDRLALIKSIHNESFMPLLDTRTFSQSPFQNLYSLQHNWPNICLI